ncbi:MAG: GYD domain-containing protein [Miltoncostaeaceae bacterium]
MPTYILLSTLSPHGVGTLKSNPERLREVNSEIEQMGAKVISQWAVLGPYDFVNILEAPDERVIARVSMELGARGTAHFQTLTAIPVDEFLDILS